mgnify:CR=1 FL=1
MDTMFLLEMKVNKMGKIKDLTGKQFGELTVISKTDKRTSDRRVIWLCQCSCGNIIEVSSHSIIQGYTKSCGHLFKEHLNKLHKNNIVNLSQQRFGKLIAIKPTERRSGDSVIWECQCDCGNICYVSSHHLKSGSTISCGCVNSHGEALIQEILTKLNINFITQYTFKDCKNPKTNRLLRFDFYLPDYNYCIEYDGIQHFKTSYGNSWNTKEHLIGTQYRDNIKNIYCNHHNIKLIRIPYTDFDKLNEQYFHEKGI